MFRHLFDAYAKWYNSKFDRTGELFESTFERKWINSDKYLKTMVEYIHYNPVHHHICNKIADYKWTSYQTILSDKLTKLKRNEVIEWFGDSANFIFVINKTDKFDDIEHLIIE